MSQKVMFSGLAALVIIGGLIFFMLQGDSEPVEEEETISSEEQAAQQAEAEEQLRNFMTGFGEQQARVTYEGTLNSNGEEEVQEFTMYWAGDGQRWRLEAPMDGGMALMMYDGAYFYTCTEEQRRCVQFQARQDLPEGIGALSPTTLRNEMNQAMGIMNLETSTRTIAERSATCFTGEDEQGSEGTICFDEETGVLLSVSAQNEAGGTTNLTATEAEYELSSEAFTPPYEVIEM